MQLLLIKVNGLQSTPEYALLGKKQEEDRYTPADWDKVRKLTRGRKVVLLLPNKDISLTSVNIPSKNKKQLLKAVPFALEDSLAEDIDALHFSIHQDNSEETNVAIINRQTLDSYIDLLKNQGITSHYVLPQLLAQPYPDNGWSIIRDNDLVNVRLSGFKGFICDKDLLPIFLSEQLENGNKVPELIFTNLEKSELPEALQDIPIEKKDSGQAHYPSTTDALDLNLLSGFISHKKESSVNWKAWKPTLVLGSLVGAMALGILAWQTNTLKQESGQLKLAIEKIFTSTFPKSRVVDAPQQMNSKLAQLKNRAGKTVDSPLPLIADITPLLKQYKDMTLSEIRYQDDELLLVMQSPNLTRIETFKKDVAKKAKLKVLVKSSTTTSDKVEAILVISPLTALSDNVSTTGAKA